jgi:hypothetical protein
MEMKNAKWMLPVAVLLLSGLMAAQSITSSTVKANVPFEFMVGNKAMPAGDLAIRAINLDGRVLTISNFDAHTSTLAATSHMENQQPAESTQLLFKVYGDQRYLVGIRIEGSNWTYTLPESRGLADLRARNVPYSETTLLAALK